MPISIRSIETAVPSTVVTQHDARDIFSSQLGTSRLGQRLTRAAFDASGIDTRHTVLDDLDALSVPTGTAEERKPVFYDATTGTLLAPSTGTRNDIYIERTPELILDAARRAVGSADGIDASDITHLITVSCTGFYAPGPDYVLVRGLDLSPATQRYHLGFMGCYGSFPALRAAHDFCTADPDAVVLVVSVELCSLHLNASDDPDTIVAASVFADGAAAAIVTGRPAPAGATVLDLDTHQTVLTPVGEQDMAWTIGDTGFDMILSRYVPHIIEEHIVSALEPILASVPGAHDAPASVIEHWAVHPGGRSILDKVQSTLRLTDAQMLPSREVLRENGNMSSATILFILRRILHGLDEVVGGSADAADGSRDATGVSSGPARVCAMAFGPGLTVESATLTLRTT